ncbi:hypothetical protein A3D77_02715 [Candidatus Gottesmanbacteria bacterium RIFCSPHIGHO2_02_FULL_39_11]|uniref:Type II secretion system protein GspG C-terminal domain-containing protein n=1 Tax=Candidatus Gottesmanbacteria bacterium RIFCSPHIGHO2_02_FULL_39_11 TaxID=1798382 RepID=A0A1F5ZTC4_9BACT|nr:MAG: hypothetical protein A3D77_02715 [Candidatus Gottesmanbacteria bacterium RIFCSPHIGHO2_02_FULL_39_11]
MNQFSSSLKKGFTLIEILIVISLLGVLAVALLATIDPLEQIRKGQDSKTQNLITELNGAMDRYYATRQEYTWQAASPSIIQLTSANQTTYVDPLITAGELKTNFTTVAGTNLTTIYLSGTPSSKVLCFRPTSKAMLFDKNSHYAVDHSGAAGPGTCKGDTTPGATDCDWCVSS